MSFPHNFSAAPLASGTSFSPRITRIGAATSVYTVPSTNPNATPVAFSISPIYDMRAGLHYAPPAPSFSAQLLELGLKHQVDGLVHKAHEQLAYHGMEVPSGANARAAYHYERAQDNFARANLHVVEQTL